MGAREDHHVSENGGWFLEASVEGFKELSESGS